MIPQARHEWVLIVDADERVSPALAAEIREVLRQDPADIDGYWIPFRCFFMGHELRHSGWNTPACRLIRRDKCRYKADVSVHEEIEIAPDRAGRLNAPFLHYSYWTYDEYFEKYLHYTRLRSWDMWDAGKRSGLLSLLVRPALRFIHMYIVRGGFRDGLAGVQICVLTAFFNTFVKQARLWEREHALPQPDPDHDLVTAQRGIGLVAESSEANCRLAWRAAREQTVLRRVA